MDLDEMLEQHSHLVQKTDEKNKSDDAQEDPQHTISDAG